MRILPPFEEKIRSQIRDELAKKPTLTMVELKEQLEKTFGRDFHHTYLRKLVGKVRNQLTHDLDRTQIEERMAFTRENYRMMREELLKIVYWTADDLATISKPLARDRIEAAKNVVMMDLALLQAEIANGMYKKPLDVIAAEFRYEPLPADVRAVIIGSWRNFGMLPAGVVEKMVPEKITS